MAQDDSRESETFAGPNNATKVETCSIDVNERICRICHLSAEESGEKGVDLMMMMELGCGCKGELEVAHLPCAEAWFKVKGNR